MNKGDVYQDYVDEEAAKPFVTVRDHNADNIPVEASQSDIIDQAEVPMDATVHGVAQIPIQPEDDVGSRNANRVEQLESYEPKQKKIPFGWGEARSVHSRGS